MIPLPVRPGRSTATLQQTRENYRESYHFTEMGECILAGRSIAADLGATHRFAWWLAGAGFGVLAFGLGGGWWLASRALRPVENISLAASRISEGNLSERINIADTDSELGQLASLLNSTFARLDASFAQQKQFTADAAHELRTPLAVIISEAQTTLARERTAPEYSETVETCLDAAQEMRRLTQYLLELSRLDAGQDKLVRTSFDLSERGRFCGGLLAPLARQKNITMHFDGPPVTAVGDPDRISQVITNLLANAIHYNSEGGEIWFSASQQGEWTVFTVTDTGFGISAEDLPHIFERFYRADRSRSQANGRSGLGLAIARAIVSAHGGEIEVTSKLEEGTTFTVRMPG